MSKDDPGYPLPDGETYIPELKCIRVWYPDHYLYKAALMGSLHYLTKWLAWERGKNQRAKGAARAWRKAWEKTTDEIDQGCGDMCNCDELSQKLDLILAEFEKLKSEHEESSMCGHNPCCCCSNQPDDEPTDQTDIPPDIPNDWPTTINLCGFATYAMTNFILSVNKLYNKAKLGRLTLAIVKSIISSIPLIRFGSALIYPVILALGSQAENILFQCIALFTEQSTPILCAIVNSPSPTAARSAVNAIISSASQPWLIRNVATLLFYWVDLNAIFNGDITLPPSYAALDCSALCGGDTPPEPGPTPPAPTGYEFIPMENLVDDPVAGNVPYTFSTAVNRYTYTGSQGSGKFFTARTNADAPPPGRVIVGYCVRVDDVHQENSNSSTALKVWGEGGLSSGFELAGQMGDLGALVLKGANDDAYNAMLATGLFVYLVADGSRDETSDNWPDGILLVTQKHTGTGQVGGQFGYTVAWWWIAEVA